MAELVDALVSEASEETHGGSSPLGHTIFILFLQISRLCNACIMNHKYAKYIKKI